MNLSKKISWRAAAVAAAVMVAGVAQADHRGGGHRDHGRDRGGDHQRVWRDQGHHYYGYSNRGPSRYSSRYYDYRPHPRHYGYRDYYNAGWPTYYRPYSYGPSLTFEIPLF